MLLVRAKSPQKPSNDGTGSHDGERHIEMTAELLYKSFHSTEGDFRGYGTLILDDTHLTYTVLFKPEKEIKITLWNVIQVDDPLWVHRQGFEVNVVIY